MYRDNKGVALIITLWVLVLLSVMALSFSLSTRSSSKSARNFKEDTHAHYLAVNAYEEAMAYLMSDPDLQVDYIDAEGNFHTDEERVPITGQRDLDGARVELIISDEESKININMATKDTLKDLLRDSGADDKSLPELLDSLMDWLDHDDLHHIQGAEDEHYEPLGYLAKNRRMDIPKELLLVNGFFDSELSVEIDVDSFMDKITTFGQGININTADSDVLRIIGLGALELDMVASRREAGEIFRRANIRGLQHYGVTKSTFYRITVKAFNGDNPSGVMITSIVQRLGTIDEPQLKVVYWKENFETSGT